ncbi:hypothetical protein ACQJBY_041614 [Aegilops geniculata]
MGRGICGREGAALAENLGDGDGPQGAARGPEERPPQELLRRHQRAEAADAGGGDGYNAFLATTLPPEHRIYDPDAESVESATATFLTAFPRGFAIEVLDVYSGPPNPRIAFKFRHWGYMEGPFKGHAPHGRRVEFFGVCVFHVDEDTKVEKAEFFYERGNFLASFLSAPASATASASGCPVMRGDGSATESTKHACQ